MATIVENAEAIAPAVRAACPDIERLRAEAKQLHEKLRTSRQRARSHLLDERRAGFRGNHSNDFEHFLQRKILKNSLRIAQHIAEHGCEELGRQS